jgi:hypothetical protein
MDYTLLSKNAQIQIVAQQVTSMEQQHFQAALAKEIAEATSRVEDAAGFAITIRQAEIALDLLRANLDEIAPPGSDARKKVDERFSGAQTQPVSPLRPVRPARNGS